MLDTNVDEIDGALAAAKNLNAALKKFLRVEGTSSPQVNAFAKDFRGAVSRGRPEAVRGFIEKNFPKRELYFLGVVRYAHAEFFEGVLGDVFREYADRFNATYEKTSSGVKLSDEKEFSSIARAVLDMVSERIKAAELPESNFLKKAMLVSIFEQEVLAEVVKVLRA
jgi:hypothetical protein